MLTYFTVTPDDIKYGIRRNPCACPVSLAIQRRLRKTWRSCLIITTTADHLTITYTTWNGSQDLIRADFKLPLEITRRILDYDGCYGGYSKHGLFANVEPQPMKPFTLALDIPEYLQPLIKPPLRLTA